MKIMYSAPCKGEGCTHRFTTEGEPKGAPPSGKPTGAPVVLLTCPECQSTREIPVKEFKAPAAAVEAPASKSEE